MYRTDIEYLYRWQKKKDKKPLIIRGARRVGKTWLIKEFGTKAYKNCIYINFDNNSYMQELFSYNLNIEKIVAGLELYIGYKIEPLNTIIIFDEIQEAPKFLALLKYFNENTPQYNIICAGSPLSMVLYKDTSFFEKEVEILDLYPLSFSEFMIALGKSQLYNFLKEGDYSMVATLKQDYIDLLKQYYYVGGMPEAILNFLQNKNFNRVRKIQENILSICKQDFSKYAPSEIVPKIHMLWNSIPKQLLKENKKFIYGLIKKGARAKEYKDAILWLTDCGLVHKVHRVTSPNAPLKSYEDLKAFKLFLLDIGLLSCMLNLRKNILLHGNDVFKEFKGALTEQYVLQQLKTFKSIDLYFWTNVKGIGEIDLLLDTGKDIIPVQVKAERNLQSKILKVYKYRYNPHICIRASISDYKKDDWFLNLPLYAIEMISSV